MPPWLVEFLWGAIPAFFKSLLEGLRKKQAIQDQGAADQRAADEEANAEIVTEAKAEADAIEHTDDADLARRADRWRV